MFHNNNHNNQIIHTLSDIENITSNTSLAIDTQNRNIENIQNNNNELEYLQRKSDYAIRNLSFFGRIINWIFGEPIKDKPEHLIESTDINKHNKQNLSLPSTPTNNDIFLYDDIFNKLDNIKHNQLLISDALDKQNHNLNNITSKKNIIFQEC
jgi:hypothetical protein